MEGDIASGVVGLHAFCQQTVEREGLVIAPCHQALDHKAPDLLHCKTPDDEGVEAVKGAENTLNQPAPFWRVGIDIGHMGKIRRQRRCTMHSDGVALLRPYLVGAGDEPQAESEDAADKSVNNYALRNTRHDRLI